MRKIVILGAGGHAREQLDLIRSLEGTQGPHDVLGFIVDPEYVGHDELVRDLPILGSWDWLAKHSDEVEVVCGIGAPSDRATVVDRAQNVGARFRRLVHPSAVMSDSVVLGEGAIISAGVVLTSNIEIGAHTHVNIGSTVSHDCVLEDFVSLSPGVHLAGGVHVRVGAMLGVGSVVREGREIGAWSRTGAGAAVVDDVPANSTVVGVPARVIERRDESDDSTG